MHIYSQPPYRLSHHWHQAFGVFRCPNDTAYELETLTDIHTIVGKRLKFQSNVTMLLFSLSASRLRQILRQYVRTLTELRHWIYSAMVAKDCVWSVWCIHGSNHELPFQIHQAQKCRTITSHKVSHSRCWMVKYWYCLEMLRSRSTASKAEYGFDGMMFMYDV